MPQKIINAIIYRNDSQLKLVNLLTEKETDCRYPLLMQFNEGAPIAETSIALVTVADDGGITCHAGVHLYDKNDAKLTVKKLPLDEIISISYKAAMNYQKMSLGA